MVIAFCGGVDEELDDGLGIARTVVGERLNVPIGIVQQPGGDGRNHVAVTPQASRSAEMRARRFLPLPSVKGESFQIGRAR